MSGNIHDTKVNLLRKEISEMLHDMSNMFKENKDPRESEEAFQIKYGNLYKTSQTLFKFILTKYGNSSFDQKYFEETINKMLNSIVEIQQSKMTEYDASVNIGEHLAKKYIPQYKK